MPASVAFSPALELPDFGSWTNAIAIIPYDENVLNYDLGKKSLVDLPNGSPAVEAVDRFMDSIIGKR